MSTEVFRICHLPFIIQAKAFDKSKGVKCVSITIVISNINEVTREILNFFMQNFHNRKKAQNAYKRTKTKNAPKKHLRGKLSLIRLFGFCAFAGVSLCCLVLFVLLVLLVLLVCAKCFRKKNIEFKTALITSFLLLLKRLRPGQLKRKQIRPI